MLSSWEKDAARYTIAAGADLQQAAQVATVMEHAPAAYLGLLKVGSAGRHPEIDEGDHTDLGEDVEVIDVEVANATAAPAV